MLFRFGMYQKSALEHLFDREGTDVALEHVLNLDDILQEMRTQSGKLIEYLSQNDRLLQLLQYATADPLPIPEEDLDEYEDGEEDRREHKYPQVAADILCADSERLCTQVVSNEEFMRRLFNIVHSQTFASDAARSDNWIRIMTALLNRKPLQMLSYLTSMDQDFVTALLDRIGVPGMDDLLLKLMCCDSLENDEEGPFSMSVTNNYPYRIKLFEALHTYARRQRQKEEQGEESPLVTAANSTGANDMDFATVIDWWASHNVISKLIERLDPEYDSDVHTGVCYTFAEALRRSASSRTIVHMDHPIVARLHSTDIMEQLMDKILSHPQCTVLQHGVVLWSMLVESVFDEDGEKHHPNAAPPPSIGIILSRLPQLISILQNPPAMDPIETTSGTLDPPLGETRLKIVEFLASLFHVRSTDIEQELIKCNSIGVVLDLFFQYEFNNMLHFQVLHIINYILCSDSLDMKRALFVENGLIDRILAANKANEEAIAQPKGMRKGHMGHIIAISNDIVASSASDPAVAEMIGTNEEWIKFVRTTLAERNILDSAILGGQAPLYAQGMDFENQFQQFAMHGEDNGDEDDGDDEFNSSLPENMQQNDVDMLDEGDFVDEDSNLDSEDQEADSTQPASDNADSQMDEGDAMAEDTVEKSSMDDGDSQDVAEISESNQDDEPLRIHKDQVSSASDPGSSEDSSVDQEMGDNNNNASSTMNDASNDMDQKSAEHAAESDSHEVVDIDPASTLPTAQQHQ